MLPHANSLSISSVSIVHNFIIQLLVTTTLWVDFVKLLTEYILTISLAKPKWFQDKEKQGKHKTVNRKLPHEWNNLNFWEFYSFISRNRVCDFKIMQYLWKKLMHELMWLIFVVPTYNYLFDFFLIFWLWKSLIYMLHLPGTIKLLHYTFICSIIYNI